MKRTRKWAFIGQEAQRLANLGLSQVEIGQRLQVRQSTVSRWLSTGKLTKPATRPQPVAWAPGKGPRAASQWAAKVRETYALAATDEQLVILGQQALELANNTSETPPTRLAAMGRFQSLVTQLKLGRSDREKPEQSAEQPSAPRPRAVPVRTGGDPRSLLQVVK